MKYNIFIKDDYLKPVEKNVSKEDLSKYGKIIEKIYDNYDKENAKLIGYVLENNYYALSERAK